MKAGKGHPVDLSIIAINRPAWRESNGRVNRNIVHNGDQPIVHDISSP